MRRVYSVPFVNLLWHIDGYHKVKYDTTSATSYAPLTAESLLPSLSVGRLSFTAE